jgi:hypothetical protein
MAESFGLRMAVAGGLVSVEDAEACLDYESPVPLFVTGREASEHGLSAIEDPPPEAVRVIGKIARRRT